MEITIMDHLWAAPENGKNGSSSRTRYAISKYDETGNNLTAPSDITAPTQAYTDSTNNTVKYSDWGGWSLEMPKPTDAKPYIWAVTYILVDPANEYLVSANGTEALHFARISGPKGDQGDKGDKGDKGDNGSASRMRYALSKVTVSSNSTTPPSDVAAPNYWTGTGYLGIYNDATNGDGWGDWSLNIPTPTEEKPYIWSISYMLVDGTDEYKVRCTDNNTFIYKRVTGEKGDKGDKGDKGETGDDGSDGNGILSVTSLFAISQKKNVTSYYDISGWSETFQMPTADKPYVWKCLKTVYTKSSTTYSTPELIAVYSPGVNPNLLRNASFISLDRMSAWQYQGGTIVGNGHNGRNYYHTVFSRRKSESENKDTLLQTLYKSWDVQRIKPSKWYTLSYWSKQGAEDMVFFTTFSDYGNSDTRKDLYLFAGHTYTLYVNGKCTKGTDYNDRYLRIYIWKENSSGVWTTAWSLDINETYTVEKELTFTPSEEGEYHIEAYLYPQKGSDGKDYGTATLNFWRLVDNTRVAASYVFPSAVDTSAGYYIDGKEYTDNNTDLHCILTPGSSTEWQRHVITFKTLSSFVYTTDGENLLFRLFASPMTGQNVYLDICEPKLEEGMFATGFIDGQEDLAGKLGPMAFLSGEWNKDNSYTRTDEMTPVVHHSDAYWYQRNNGTSKGDEPVAGSKVWRIAQEFEVVFAKIVFAAFANLGSAVFSGDWMFSQRGRQYDTTKSAFTYNYDYKNFDPTTYTESDDRDWRPMVAIDFREGIMRAINMIAIGGTFENVDISGKMTANLFYGKTKDLTTVKNYTIDPVNDPANCYVWNEPASGHYYVKLPKASDYDGLELSFFVKWGQTEIGIRQLHISCVESTDHLYCRCSAHYDYGATEKRFIPTYDNLTVGYTDFIGTSVTVYWNQFVKFKSMGGAWFAIQGVFTGE